jgi:hypothetical protein
MEFPRFAGSENVVNPALDLFTVPPTDFAVIQSDYQQVLPSVMVKRRSIPITFRIEKSTTGFLDLRDSFLYIRASLKNVDGSNLLPTQKLAPENLFLHTMFQNVNVKLNGQAICETSMMYPYQAWMMKQLTNGAGIKESELTKELYFKDTSPDDFSESSVSFQNRLKVSTGSKSFEMVGRICDSVFDLPRYLPNNVVVDIELKQSPPSFCLSASDESISGFVDIEDAQLFVRRHEIHPEMEQSIAKDFENGNVALYPCRKSVMRAMHIDKGRRDFISGPVFRGILPEVLCFGLVSHEAFSGSLSKNPFNFQNYKLSSFVVTINDRPAVYREIECDYEKNQYILGYNSILKATKGYTSGNYLTTEDYLRGNTLYVLDIASAAPNKFHTDNVGEIKFRIHFAEALTENITLVVLGQTQSMFEVDADGEVRIEKREN